MASTAQTLWWLWTRNKTRGSLLQDLPLNATTTTSTERVPHFQTTSGDLNRHWILTNMMTQFLDRLSKASHSIIWSFLASSLSKMSLDLSWGVALTLMLRQNHWLQHFYRSITRQYSTKSQLLIKTLTILLITTPANLFPREEAKQAIKIKGTKVKL
jgi:hypothetical protein